MPPPVLTQVIASMASIMGVAPEPPNRPTVPRQLRSSPTPVPPPRTCCPAGWIFPHRSRTARKARFVCVVSHSTLAIFREGLKKLGFITYGSDDSPIVPLMLFNPGKMCVFSRMMKQRATPIFTVVVAYPATPLVTSRVRFCLSAAHTKDDIDLILKACDEIGDWLDLKQGSGERWPLQEIMDRAVELVHMDMD
jgi:serine palmitoyltransferase